MNKLFTIILILLTLCMNTNAEQNNQAIFAGGCFWCMEPVFKQLPGVLSTEVGYIGGVINNPSYEEVSSGVTGHVEAIRIQYDPKLISYTALLDKFWQNIDPLDDGGQFCDQGDQYRTKIFVTSDQQRIEAQQSRDAIEKKLGQKVFTEIKQAENFFAAENYHQQYYLKNPTHYNVYKNSCGRNERLGELWGQGKK